MGLMGPDGDGLDALAAVAENAALAAFAQLLDAGLPASSIVARVAVEPDAAPDTPRRLVVHVHQHARMSAHARMAAEGVLQRAVATFQTGVLPFLKCLVLDLPVLHGRKASCTYLVGPTGMAQRPVATKMEINGVRVLGPIGLFRGRVQHLRPPTGFHTCDGQRVAAASLDEAYTLAQAARAPSPPQGG
jgi:hypothetical protein